MIANQILPDSERRANPEQLKEDRVCTFCVCYCIAVVFGTIWLIAKLADLLEGR